MHTPTCISLLLLSACTMPTEVIVQSSTSTAADGGDAQLPGATCAPASLAGWSAAWVPATGVAQGQCAAADVAGLYAACFGSGATQSTCSAYQAASPTCASCALSASTDSSWGPIVVFSGTSAVNQPGCVALLDPAAAACAQAAQAQTECEHAACDSTCPVSDASSLLAWRQCADQAAAGACAGYNSDCLQADLTSDAGNDAGACGGTSFETMFVNVVSVFCGPSN